MSVESGVVRANPDVACGNGCVISYRSEETTIFINHFAATICSRVPTEERIAGLGGVGDAEVIITQIIPVRWRLTVLDFYACCTACAAIRIEGDRVGVGSPLGVEGG